MAFKYINPGYGYNANLITVENFTYNPTNGVAFRASDYALENYVSLSSEVPLPQAFCTSAYEPADIYGKFNFYLETPPEGTYPLDDFYIGAICSGEMDSMNYCIGVVISDGKIYLGDGTGMYFGEGINISPCELYSIWFHWHIDNYNDNSYGELSVNGTETTTISRSWGAGYFSSEYKFFVIGHPCYWYGGGGFYLSEIIISNEFVSRDEKTLVLPVNTTTTDMTAGASGIYTATEAGQTLLQSVDIPALTRSYRAQTPITGIGVAGIPAYYTNTLVTTITALSKTGTVTSEHGTCEIGSGSTDAIFTGWGLSNATIADLQDMQFGWKTGT